MHYIGLPCTLQLPLCGRKLKSYRKILYLYGHAVSLCCSLYMHLMISRRKMCLNPLKTDPMPVTHGPTTVACTYIPWEEGSTHAGDHRSHADHYTMRSPCGTWWLLLELVAVCMSHDCYVTDGTTGYKHHRYHSYYDHTKET